MKATLLAAMASVGVACGSAPQEARPKPLASAPAVEVAKTKQAVEGDAPVPGVVLNSGSEWTKDATVTLTVTAPVGATKYCAKAVTSGSDGTTACSTFVNLPTAESDGTYKISGIALSTGEGQKWVRVTFDSASGTKVYGSIKVDKTVPVAGTVALTNRADVDGKVGLTFSGFGDGGTVAGNKSGIASYKVYGSSSAAVTVCATTGTGSGALLATVTSGNTWTHDPVTNHTTQHYAVCAVDAAGNVSTAAKLGGVVVKPDVTAPALNAKFQMTTPAAVNSATVPVTFSLKAGGTGGLVTESNTTQVCFNETVAPCAADAAGWTTFASSMNATIGTTAQGAKTVYAHIRDNWRNVATGSPLKAVLKYDADAPTDGTATASGSLKALLTLKNFKDNTGGVGLDTTTPYIVRYSTDADAKPEAKCTDDAPATACTVDTKKAIATCNGLTNGTPYHFRVCAKDAAGNVSNGVEVTYTPKPVLPPTAASVALKASDAIKTVSGTVYSTEAAVQLSLSAAGVDGARVVQYIATTSSTFPTTPSWISLGDAAPTITNVPVDFSLGATDGAKVVNVWFMDEFQNKTDPKKPVQTKVTLDTQNPVAGKVAVTRGVKTKEFVVTAADFKDVTSGLASHYFSVVADGGTPTCSGADTAPAGVTCTKSADTKKTTCVVPADKVPYTVGVCAFDKAGRQSAIVTSASFVTAPTAAAPTAAKVTINNAAVWATSTSVSLKLEAKSVSPVTVEKYCVSESATCTDWQSFTSPQSNQSETVSFTLSGTDGEKKVNAFFRDEYGNTTAAVNDTIKLDTVAPAASDIAVVADPTSGSSKKVKVTVPTKSTDTSIKKWALRHAEGSVTGLGCADGTELKFGTALPTAAGGALANSPFTVAASGTRYTFVLCTYDEAGNVSAGAATEGVSSGVDAVAPTDSADQATATMGTSTASLTWSPASDNNAVDGYRVVWEGAPSSAPACPTKPTFGGFTKIDGTTFEATGLSENTSYNFRICAYDAAGNNSVGIELSGSTSSACTSNYADGDSCGYCGSFSSASCSCNDPCADGNSCGTCGTYSAGNCNEPSGGGSYGYCGWCDACGNCSDSCADGQPCGTCGTYSGGSCYEPSNGGMACGYCGTTDNCGNCSDSCADGNSCGVNGTYQSGTCVEACPSGTHNYNGSCVCDDGTYEGSLGTNSRYNGNGPSCKYPQNDFYHYGMTNYGLSAWGACRDLRNGGLACMWTSDCISGDTCSNYYCEGRGQKNDYEGCSYEGYNTNGVKSGYCVSGSCTELRSTGSWCSDNRQCQSGTCNSNYCD